MMTYTEASKKSGNVIVQNGNPILAIQFSSKFMGSSEEDPRAKAYYNKLYSSRIGYDRPVDFWEIPRWIAELNAITKTDLMVIRDIAEAKEFLSSCSYSEIAFSVLDCIKSFVLELIPFFNGKITLGGYTDNSVFLGMENVTWYNSMSEYAGKNGFPYSFSMDYSLFTGTKVIPRLCLSQGCLHRCAFCSIPKGITEIPIDRIMAQINSFKPLSFKLVYLDDKTFGQAKNYSILPSLAEIIKGYNPEFEGFIIQTTASMMKSFSIEWLKASGIKFIEIGVETFNDSILKSLHKPASEKLIQEATDKIASSGIWLIPNIIIGIPDETEETYSKTLRYLRDNQTKISHANIYSLAIYENTEIGEKIGPLTEDDLNENKVGKSFHEDKVIVEEFANEIYSLGMKFLDNGYSHFPEIPLW